MTTDIAFEIAELALGVAKGHAGGKVQQDSALADTLLQIVQKGIQAYQDHTGEALDPSIIRPAKPIS